MKPNNIIKSTLVLSCIGLVQTKNMPYRLGDNFPSQVLKDTQAVRKIREYKSHTDKQKEEYDNKVTKIAGSFSQRRSLAEKWNETQVILDIHECALGHYYPNIKSLNDDWETEVKNRLFKSRLLGDIFDRKHKDIFIKEYENNKEFTEIIKASDGVLKRKSDNNFIKICVDNDIVVQIDELQMRNKQVIAIYRTPMIQTFFSTGNRWQYPVALEPYKPLYASQKTLEKHMSIIANKLLDGNFKNQDEAIDLLLDYKILSCLPFAIQEQLGTQFKNIVKINYLTEAIKQKFPEKIDKNLNIPHIIDYEEFNKSGVLRSPEIAIIALTPNKFKKIQKKQIKAELKKSYEEL